MSKLLEKYVKMLESGLLTEQQIVNLRSVIASSKGKLTNKEINLLVCKFYELMPNEGYRITTEQTNKGREFLLNHCFTSKGLPRKQVNHLGSRELDIIRDLQDFRFTGLHCYNQAGYTLPIYTAIDGKGNSFRYYYNGKLEVIGSVMKNNRPRLRIVG